MKITKDYLRNLIKEEIENRAQINEAMSDYNPLEILSTAGKYYLKLGKMIAKGDMDKAQQQFSKDMDATVSGHLETLSYIPLFGAFPGAALVLLYLIAGQYKKALIALLIAAASILGGKLILKGGRYAGGRLLAHPRVLEKATQLLDVLQRAADRIPGGDRIARGALTLAALMGTPGGIKVIKDISQTIGEEGLEEYEQKNKVVAKQLDSLKSIIKKNPEAEELTSQAFKRKQGPGVSDVQPGEMYAGNRKDNSSLGGLFKESHTSGDPRMKLTMSQLRTLVQEEINKLDEEDDSFSKAGEEIAKKGTEGVFTAKAKKRGMTAQEFARKVLANTDEYDTKTVRQASFAKGAKTVADKK